MKYALYLLVCIFAFNSAESQNANVEPSNSFQAYDEYFKMPRESLYLHLNKSSYLRGESIWFQGYAYDRKTQNLNPDTRNVELGVYDSEGKMIDKQLFLVVDGLFRGQISIDDTFADGEYYLKAETQYMKNFKKDYAHVQKFEVLGSEVKITKQEFRSYDLQILPEGGHIVRNAHNMLGFKLINQDGLGVKFKAEILENGIPVFDFQSNRFGHAKAEFKPVNNKDYKVKVTLPNGDILNEPIKNIRPYGYVLKVNNYLKDQTIVQVSAHLDANEKYDQNKVRLMVHQEGKEFHIPFYFTQEIKEVYKTISVEQLFYGVNTITLFVNDKPVAERLIFNRAKTLDNENDVLVKTKNISKQDSLSLLLSLPKFDKNANLSISVLPERSISYAKNQNISSALLLDPFVNGYIENKSYYFKDTSRRVDYNLDLLLLTQGWSSYTWDNIFSNPPVNNYKRVDGLTQHIDLKGRVPKNAEKLLLFGTIYNEEKVLQLNEDNSYTLENRYPVIGEKIEFSLINNKEKYKKGKLIVGTVLNLEKDQIDADNFISSLSNLRKLKLDLNNDRLYDNFLQGELLDEIIIKQKKTEPSDEKDYVNNFANNKVVVDNDFINTFPFLSDYFVTRGYLVNDEIGNFSIRTMSRISFAGSNSPAVFLNGVLLNDLSILSRSRTSDYEEIFVDRTGYGSGLLGAAGVIRLELRKTAVFDQPYDSDEELPYSNYEIEYGFEPPKRFYLPEYKFFNTESFQQVGTIAWFSDVSIKGGETVELPMFDTGLKRFTLHIEGIASDGSLINIEKTIAQ